MYYANKKTKNPSHWGRATWDALFLLASDFPSTQKLADDDTPVNARCMRKRRTAWAKMLKALPGVLPCQDCAIHFQEYLERDDGRALQNALKDRNSLMAWLHNAKQLVNKRQHKKGITLKEVQKRYLGACVEIKSPRGRKK